jgi:hypothetical protein
MPATKRPAAVQKVSLGRSALVSGKDRTAALGYARREFLQAVERKCPEVLTVLAQDVLARFVTSAYEQARLEWATQFHLTRTLQLNRRFEMARDRLTLRCDRGPTVPPSWIALQVDSTLKYWLTHPELPRDQWYRWMAISAAKESLHFDNLTIFFQNPLRRSPGESLSTTKRRWKLRAGEAVDRYFQGIMDFADARGYGKPAEIPRAYFDWAAQFQVGNQSVPDIVPEVFRHGNIIDERTIRRGVRIVLQLVGLDRRLEPSGRKTKRSRTS